MVKALIWQGKVVSFEPEVTFVGVNWWWD